MFTEVLIIVCVCIIAATLFNVEGQAHWLRRCPSLMILMKVSRMYVCMYVCT